MKNGNVDFFNKSASRMIGVPIEEAIGKTITEVIPTTRTSKGIRIRKSGIE